MTSPPRPAPLKGRLIVANPLLADPNFDRTVVLVLAHGDDGALGVVLNRPSATTVAEVLPRWARAVGPPAVIFVGGPVNPEAVIGLARSGGGAGGRRLSGRSAEWTTVRDDIGTLDLELDPDEIVGDVMAMRVFVGYSGWGAGQLEEEIAAEAWWVLDAAPDDAFARRPTELWRDVLRRQRGSLSLVAAYPKDPALN